MSAGDPKALIPKDLQGVRQQNIGWLQHPDQFLKMLQGLVPQNGLQTGGMNAIQTQLGQATPEQRALDTAMPSLQAMLTGTGPQFERDIAVGNQEGGRFGSANAIMRGEAYRNLYNQRNQTAGTLGMLAGGAGNANRGLAQQAFNMGDQSTARQFAALMQLLGVGQQAAFNHPTQQGGGGLGSFLGSLGGMALGSFAGPFGAAAGQQLGSKLFGGGGGQ